jgi:ABC-type bacteriocin/lantibiotic exporter with double-glycine peptidase domain
MNSDYIFIFNLFLTVSIETWISTLEAKIGTQIWLYVILFVLSQLASTFKFYSNNDGANRKMLEYKKEKLELYNKLDDASKEKDTLESFQNKLDKSSWVIQSKYSWGINIVTSLISCFSSLSVIFIKNGEIYLLFTFILINLIWLKYVIFYGIDYLDKKRTEERKSRSIIIEKLNLFMNRFYIGEALSKDVLKQYTSLIDGRFKLDIVWILVCLLQQVPNLLFLILISCLFYSEQKMQMILITFIKVRNTISSTSNFLNQWRTMENDLKAIDDFFENKTFCERSVQRNIPDTLSFTSNIKRGSTIIKTNGSIIVNNFDRIVVSGHSGCGKTTLIKGLMGHIEGINYDTDVPSDSYISQIAYMRQNIREVTPMVKVTLRNLFGDNEDDSLIIKVLQYAKLIEWFTTIMKEQLDTPIGELCTPSGGQKTRICFAMTLYRLEVNQCKWLVLDEPEQGLDPELGPDMLKTAFHMYPNVSIIMITHLCECRMKELNITQRWIIDKDGLLISK